ncbi:MAG TPA: RNA-protein complex protein Nop10 [Thermoplasmata archaeon]|nr:RNA-protein complex protein Nop10 [Thermoplasmata archaeon]HYB78043.1 RNA-protein complex protein Nop10 [Thermoplasmata archaeon]
MTNSVLRVCRSCDRYTYQDRCPACSGPTRTPHPARFDPGDRYGKYRRRLLETVQETSGRTA